MGGEGRGICPSDAAELPRQGIEEKWQHEAHCQDRHNLRRKARDRRFREFDTALEPNRQEQQHAEQVVNRRRHPQIGLCQARDETESKKQNNWIHRQSRFMFVRISRTSSMSASIWRDSASRSSCRTTASA